MLLLILLYVGSLKALVLALYYSSFTSVIFSFLQTIFHLFLLLMTLILIFFLHHKDSWFNANKLTVHLNKSKFIIFHPQSKQINPSELNISINNTPIARVQEHKFLGIIIHKNLLWKPPFTFLTPLSDFYPVIFMIT